MGYAARTLLAQPLLAIGLILGVGSDTCFAQRTVSEDPWSNDQETSGDSTNGLDAAFELLGQDWVEARTRGFRLPSLSALPDFALPPELRGRGRHIEGLGQGGAALPAHSAGMWQVDRKKTIEVAPGYGLRVIPGVGVRSEGQIGAWDTRGALSLSQAKARRAVINMLASTRLGRRLGRFFNYRNEQDAWLGSPNEAPQERRASFIPRISPRINARKGTIALSFVWRF